MYQPIDEAIALGRRLKPGARIEITVQLNGAMRVALHDADGTCDEYTRKPAGAVREEAPRSETEERAAASTAPIAEPPRVPAAEDPAGLPDLTADLYARQVVFTIAASAYRSEIHESGVAAWETQHDHATGTQRERIASDAVPESRAERVRQNLRALGIEFAETEIAPPERSQTFRVFFTTAAQWDALDQKTREALRSVSDPGWGYGNWPDDVSEHRYIATKPLDERAADVVGDRCDEVAGFDYYVKAAPLWTCLACKRPGLAPLGIGGRCAACDAAVNEAPKAEKPKRTRKAKAAKVEKGAEACGDDSSTESGASSDSAPATVPVESVTSPSPEAPVESAVSSPSNSDASVERADETSDVSSSTSADDDEFAVPADRQSGEPARPAWLDAASEVPDPDMADFDARKHHPPQATIHIDGTGIHGHLFHVLDIDAAGAAIRARLSAEPGVSLTFGKIDRAEPTWRAAFNTVICTVEKRKQLLADLKSALESQGIEVTSAADWTPAQVPAVPKTEAIAANPPPSPGKLAPTPPPPPPGDQTQLPKSGHYAIEITPQQWSKLDPNQRAKVKRTLRKASIEFDEGVDTVTPRSTPKNNAGVLEVLRVLRELGVETEARAA